MISSTRFAIAVRLGPRVRLMIKALQPLYRPLDPLVAIAHRASSGSIGTSRTQTPSAADRDPHRLDASDDGVRILSVRSASPS